MTGAALREVLQRQGNDKAKGADWSSPRELALLRHSWLNALGSMVGCWEAVGKWPEALRNVIFSMIPESKAETKRD